MRSVSADRAHTAHRITKTNVGLDLHKRECQFLTRSDRGSNLNQSRRSKRGGVRKAESSPLSLPIPYTPFLYFPCTPYDGTGPSPLNLSSAPLSVAYCRSNEVIYVVYRRAIDGLRAVAVLPVMLFHAGLSGFAGGFVGVDIFFVISGYLITSIILKDLERGSFSIAHFYERRTKRILPALLVVILACFPFAWLWLSPNELTAFAKSLTAVAVFGSNVYFWLKSDYFAADADLEPLLHTWSLAVEEQYYVIFPVLLVLVWKLRKSALPATLVILALSSFAISLYGVQHHPNAAFYLLPSRGWELLLGAIVALAYPTPLLHEGKVWRRTAHEVAAVLGLALIGWSVFSFDSETRFPGMAALAPTVGTAAVLAFAGDRTLVGQLLGTKPFVGLGLISYSAYLWHQPMLAFARHRSIEVLGTAQVVYILLATLALAGLTWFFVEQPLRRNQEIRRRHLFAAAATASLFLVVVGVLGTTTGGIAFRKNVTSFAKADRGLMGNPGLNEACSLDVEDPVFRLPAECYTSEAPELVLWGDSFAMHLVQGVLSSRPDARLAQVTASSCGPILGLAITSARTSAEHAQDCIRHNYKVIEWIAKQKSVTHVLVSSPFRQLAPGQTLVYADRSGSTDAVDAIGALRATLAALEKIGVTPVVFSPPPRTGQNIGGCLSRAIRYSAALARCDFTRAAVDSAYGYLWDALREISRDYKVVWLKDGLCDKDRCRASFGDSIPIYRDQGHLSSEGSEILGRAMDWYGLAVSSERSP